MRELLSNQFQETLSNSANLYMPNDAIMAETGVENFC